MQHLQSDAKLAIAPSRRLRDIGVPNKALGLYAAHPRVRLAKDRQGFPMPSALQPRLRDDETGAQQRGPAIAFRVGQVVTIYGGEVLTREQFDDRYDDPGNMDTAAYAVQMAPRAAMGTGADGRRQRQLDAVGDPVTHRNVVDGLAAASAATYSNEPLDIAAVMRASRDRADFQHRYDAAAATAANSALVNVRTRQRQGAVELVAIKPIEHGREILWNYTWGYWAGETMKRYVTGTGW
jgi:hypothetical protein